MRQSPFILIAAILMNSCTSKTPPHIARGHLLAAFCSAHPEKKPERVVAIYREIIPINAPKSSYTTVAFSGGYVGLAGNKDGNGGDQINFSIWGTDCIEIESANKKYGSIKTRQFTHEGTGWAGRLAYPWQLGKRYRIFVHVKHENQKTIFSAWFGSADESEWLLAGRIEKTGIHYLSHAGGFLEHAGKKHMEIPRSTGFGPSWIHDGKTWQPCIEAKVKLKDPDNARFYQQDNLVIIEIGLGIKSLLGDRYTYSILGESQQPLDLPEEVCTYSN